MGYQGYPMRQLIILYVACATLSACSKQQVPTAVVDAQVLPPKSLSDYRVEAEAVAKTIKVADAKRLVGDDSVVFVDIRESVEITKSGKIEGAVHVPRGYLEFVIDPAGPLHSDEFSSGKQVILYCETGGRSLLAAKLAVEMGLTDAVHLDGGFRAWKRADGAIDTSSESN